MILSVRMKVGLAFLAERWVCVYVDWHLLMLQTWKFPTLHPYRTYTLTQPLKVRKTEATGERGGVKSAVGSAEINVLWNKSIGCDLWCHLHRPTSCTHDSDTEQTRAHKAETGHCTVAWLPITEAIATWPLWLTSEFWSHPCIHFLRAVMIILILQSTQRRSN